MLPSNLYYLLYHRLRQNAISDFIGLHRMLIASLPGQTGSARPRS